jgi:hypothetical protein
MKLLDVVIIACRHVGLIAARTLARQLHIAVVFGRLRLRVLSQLWLIPHVHGPNVGP